MRKATFEFAVQTDPEEPPVCEAVAARMVVWDVSIVRKLTADLAIQTDPEEMLVAGEEPIAVK